MMMNRLPSRYIGLYIKKLEQGGLRVPFFSFFVAVIRHFGVHVSQLVPMGVNGVILFEIRYITLNINHTASLFWVFYKLCKQGHWFSFKNKTGRDTKKCFKKATSSLKGWKKKFFLLDRRAILDAMPWRHGDTDLHDDFLITYKENDNDCLSEFLVPLRPPPRHLLYMCGLTMACRHPDLQYNIKDKDKNVISMDTFLKLPTWTRTVISKGDPVLEDQCPKPRVTPLLVVGVTISELTPFQKNLEKPNSKIAAAREKKDQQNVAKAEAKHAGVGATGAALEVVKKPATVASEVSPHVEKEVVNLSGNKRVSTPLVVNTQPSPHLEYQDAHVNITLNDSGAIHYGLRGAFEEARAAESRLCRPTEPLVPSCCVIFDLEPLSLSFDFVFTSEIFKSLSFSLDRLCHLAILCLDQHARTLHHLENLITISLGRLDILKEYLLSCLLEEQLLEPALNWTVHCCGREFQVLNCYDQKSLFVHQIRIPGSLGF
ncbi:hypothetical protein Tco_0646586 [Tanacetum coccineum]